MCAGNGQEKFFHAVLIDKLHPMKRSAGLCLCLNFFLGLRVGELAALRWEDVHLPERYVYVHITQTRAYKRDESGARLENEYFIQDTTKTLHSVRSIPLIRESVYILTELKKWHDRMGYTSPMMALMWYSPIRLTARSTGFVSSVVSLVSTRTKSARHLRVNCTGTACLPR